MDEIINVSIMDDNENILSELRIAIPKEELGKFINDFEDHFLKNYDEAELL